MRRSTSVLLVAVAALLLAAVVDALLPDSPEGEPPRARPAAERLTTNERAVARLRARRVSGILYVTERRADACRFRAFRLPDLASLADVGTRLCRVEAGPPETVGLWRRCPSGPIEVR